MKNKNSIVYHFKVGSRVYFNGEEIGSIPCKVLEVKEDILVLDNGYDKPFEAKVSDCEPQDDLLTFDEGFMKYKKFYNQPREYGTTINVEGYEPFKINGFRLEKTDKHGNYMEITENDLLEQYKKRLIGDEGEPI